MAGGWARAQRDLLKDVLDHLIPPHPERGIPGGGAVAVDYVWACAVADHGFAEALHTMLRCLAALSGPLSPEMIGRAETGHPQAFAALVRHTYMGYYSRPDIRPHFGVASRAVHPKGYEVAAESRDELDALLEPVRARGKVYRDR